LGCSCAADPVQQAVRRHLDLVARLVPGVGLLVGERVRHLVRDVLDQSAAQGHVEQLLPAADAEQWQISAERSAGHRQLEPGAPFLGRDLGVAGVGAEMGRVHVEVATGHDQTVQPLQVALRLVGLVG
jgi:hypothetical protein